MSDDVCHVLFWIENRVGSFIRMESYVRTTQNQEQVRCNTVFLNKHGALVNRLSHEQSMRCSASIDLI